jgi:citrate lyase subunit beta / citryl-CoA lyase
VSTGTIPAAGVRSGEAGRRGGDVRSDLHVTVEARAEGGLHVEVESRVAALYGDRIRDTVEDTLRALGVEAATVRIEDAGAVPWVIAARVEAAARAAGLLAPDALAPLGEAMDRVLGGGAIRGGAIPAAPTEPGRLRRSRLYLPGNEPKFMLNAGLHGPDAVILDLEDSVHPDAKASARLLVRNALRRVDFHGAERMVRINQLPLGLEDLDAVVPQRPDLILIPKVERAEQVVAVAERIEAILVGQADQTDQASRPTEAQTPLAGRPAIWLMPILESALGIENAFEIARAAPSVVALTIGLEDYTADLGVAKTREGTETIWARQRLVNAARAAGVQAIDSVYGDAQDEAGLLAWGRASRAMGFVGMGCVHPRQVRVIHEAFAPSAEEIDRALRIVAAYRDAEARGLGVVSLGSKMIDPPVVLRARRLVARARETGLLTGGDE